MSGPLLPEETPSRCVDEEVPLASEPRVRMLVHLRRLLVYLAARDCEVFSWWCRMEQIDFFVAGREDELIDVVAQLSREFEEVTI